MRTIILATALLALLGAAPAYPQAVTCNAADVACRVQHNDAAVLGQKLDKLDTDLQALLKQLQSTPIAATPAPVTGSQPAAAVSTSAAPVPADAVTAFDPCASLNGAKWTTLKITPAVGINNALACAGPGFKLMFEAGVYNQVFHVPDGLGQWDIGGDVANGGNADTVKIDGRGGCTVQQNNGNGCPTRLAYGKGVIHASSAGTIHDLEVRGGGSNAQGHHDGQAGIYLDGGNGETGSFVVRHVMLRRNENGIFSNNNVGAIDIAFVECDFVDNGTDDGSHSSYMGGGSSLTLTNIHDYGSTVGNNQKSRIGKVTSTGGFQKSVQGRWIECADGCVLSITGGTFVGNTCCQNVFGNGTESILKGPGNTTWSGPSTVWLGRASNIANAGTFTASGISMRCAAGAYGANDHPAELAGWPACPANSNDPPPPDAPFISGAKS